MEDDTLENTNMYFNLAILRHKKKKKINGVIGLHQPFR